MNIYFTSDTHYYHKNIVKFSPIREMEFKKGKYNNQNDFLIDLHNKTIKDEDVVFHLGDIALCGNKEIERLKVLNGIKYYIKGNHDNFSNTKYNSIGLNYVNNNFIKIKNNELEFCNNNLLEELSLKFSKLKKLNFFILSLENGVNILCSHYPMIILSNYDLKFKEQTEALFEIYCEMNCSLNIHGHTHSLNGNEEYLYNVSVDNTNFKPIKLIDIINSK